MKIIPDDTLPVIEGTPEELIKLATAVTGAVSHQEAVMFHESKAVIGIRCVEKTIEPIPTKHQW
jgi:hypothetical protein